MALLKRSMSSSEGEPYTSSSLSRRMSMERLAGSTLTRVWRVRTHTRGVCVWVRVRVCVCVRVCGCGCVGVGA
jgi:hypothetical protein